jgi:PAS domain S-box-containing protein
MPEELRDSGIEVLGNIPWGTHFCQFYETKEDLLELLVPFFKAGLESNEYCLWILCEPITEQDAFNALQKAVPNLTDYMDKKSIEIFPCKDWYAKSGKFDAKLVNHAWLQELQDALSRGYDGMRVNGNETWLDKNNWDDFMEYENELNRLLQNRRMIVLCTYQLTRSDGRRVLDVAHAHECVVSRRQRHWEILEEPGLKKKKAELVRENKELDALVTEQTNELAKAVEDLKREIEERKRTEAQLVNEKQLLETIIDSVPGYVVLFDQSYNPLLWNKQIEKTLSYTSEKVQNIAKAADTIFRWDDQLSVKELIQQGFAAGYVSGEFNTRRLDGSKATLYFISRTIEYQDRLCLLSISVDITERKRAEEELRLAYQRLSYHVGNTPLAVLEWDKDLIITRWSEQAEKIFGWEASEALGKHIYDSDFLIIHEEDRPQVEKIVNELIQGSGDRNINLNRNYRKDGKVIYCEWYNSVLKDEHGNVITFLAFSHDVTERKEAEEKLNESYRQIRSLSEHLQNIREEERTRIAREIHDELGQHLTVLQMGISWLNKKVGNTSDAINEKLQDLMEMLGSCVQSVRRILYELRPQLLDLGLDSAIEYHLKEFEKHSGIKTSFNEPMEELELKDSTKTGLFRIFQESLTNVAKHSEASHVYVDLVKEGNQLILRVKDNGKGFDKQEITKKRTLGILGMKERCEMMGGRCNIASEPGKGTTVTITMPLTEKIN